jgi:hypothetical protein
MNTAGTSINVPVLLWETIAGVSLSRASQVKLPLTKMSWFAAAL